MDLIFLVSSQHNRGNFVHFAVFFIQTKDRRISINTTEMPTIHLRYYRDETLKTGGVHYVSTHGLLCFGLNNYPVNQK